MLPVHRQWSQKERTKRLRKVQGRPLAWCDCCLGYRFPRCVKGRGSGPRPGTALASLLWLPSLLPGVSTFRLPWALCRVGALLPWAAMPAWRQVHRAQGRPCTVCLFRPLRHRRLTCRHPTSGDYASIHPYIHAASFHTPTCPHTLTLTQIISPQIHIVKHTSVYLHSRNYSFIQHVFRPCGFLDFGCSFAAQLLNLMNHRIC